MSLPQRLTHAEYPATGHWSPVLVVAMFVMPFMVGYHILPVPSFYNEMVAFVLGVLALYPLWYRERWQCMRLPVVLLLAWLGLIPLFMYQTSIDLIPTRSQALTYSLYVLWACMLMLLGLYHQRVHALPQLIKQMAYGIIIGGWFNLGYIALQVAHKCGWISAHLWLAQSYGAIAQGNHLCSFCAIGIASVLYLRSQAALSAPRLRLRSRLAYDASLLMFLVMLTISGSRSGWLFLLSFTALAIWISLRQPDPRLQTAAKGIAIRLLAMLPLYAILQYLFTETAQAYFTTAMQRFDEFGNPQLSGGLKIRLQMWQQSMQYFWQQPWVGHGMGQTRWLSFSSLEKNLPEGMPGSYEHPHNLFMFTLSEIGLVGSLCVCVPLIVWLWGLFKQPRSLTSWWLWCVVSVLGIHAMLEYPLSYAYFLGLLAYLMGLSVKGGWMMGAWRSWLSARLTAILSVLGLLVCLHTSYSYLRLDHWMRSLMQSKPNAELINQYYETIVWLNQKSLLAAYSYPLFLLAIEYLPIDQAGKHAVNTLSMRVLPMPKSAYLAPLYLLQNNQPQQAQQAMQMAIQAYPDDYTTRLKSVPPAWLPAYQALYRTAQQQLAQP